MNRTPPRHPARLAWPLMAGALATALAGCQTMPTQRTQAPQPGAAPDCQWVAGGPTPVEAGLLGGVVGAVAGGAVATASGAKPKNVDKAALIAGIAAGLTAAVAASQSPQRTPLTAVREPDGSIKLSLPGAMLFPTGSAEVRPELTSTLQNLAREINKYCDVGVKVVGHTDDTGPFDLNMKLSRQRAEAIAGSLQKVGVLRQIQTDGLGPQKPAVPNTSDANRTSNRRVELFVVPPPGA